VLLRTHPNSSQLISSSVDHSKVFHSASRQLLLELTIKTKPIYQPREDDDGMRILITRHYPRGVRKEHFDLWLRELSPSASLLASYKQGLCSWDKFKGTFLNELLSNIDSLDTLYALNEAIRSNDITLLCYEKDKQPCHRHIIRDLIEQPRLLWSFFESENANDQERLKIPGLIANE
jgi:uncharacterized protein YeaO (DUF488 family)